MSEHLIPKYMNTKWQKKHQFYKYDKEVEQFLVKYREKLYLSKRRKRVYVHNIIYNYLIPIMIIVSGGISIMLSNY